MCILYIVIKKECRQSLHSEPHGLYKSYEKTIVTKYINYELFKQLLKL